MTSRVMLPSMEEEFCDFWIRNKVGACEMPLSMGKLSCGDRERTKSSHVSVQSGGEGLFLCSRERICRV